jgi:hypothetical protein
VAAPTVRKGPREEVPLCRYRNIEGDAEEIELYAAALEISQIKLLQKRIAEIVETPRRNPASR